MIQVAPNRSQTGLVALAVLGVAIVLVVATYKPLPADPAASADASQVAAATSPAPSSRPTTRPTAAIPPRTTPTPTRGPCELPASLPVDALSEAAPKVEGGAGSILFASPVYLTGGATPIVADDPTRAWEMGLWFVPAPGAAPRLVTAAGPGMVIPLAIAPSGKVAAVWWWPERRGASEAPCEQGIYAVNLTVPGSWLVARGDWTFEGNPDGTAGDPTWEDPTQSRYSPLQFLLPKASFSADGDLLAVVDGNVIDVYRTAFPAESVRHVGSCPRWGWATGSTRFVAGCEHMTSAWLVYLVCCDAGLETRSIPILAPPITAQVGADWEVESNRAIGFTGEGDIRIARTYGFATGCEGPDPCHIPPPSWAVTTIDWDTRTAVHGGAEVDFLFDVDTRLSADASWLYGTVYGDDPQHSVTVDLATGVVRRIGQIGAFAGASADGSTLYGVPVLDSPNLIIRAASVRSTKDVVTISWPDGAVARFAGIYVVGLWVGSPT